MAKGQSIEQIAEALEETPEHILELIEKIDVNLSVMQCMQTSMATTLLSISEIYNTPLNLINFEITETRENVFVYDGIEQIIEF